MLYLFWIAVFASVNDLCVGLDTTSAAKNHLTMAGPTHQTVMPECSIVAVDKHFRDKSAELINAGANLINYHVIFINRSSNPLLKGNRLLYRPDIWGRAASEQGKTLLTLTFNYGVMSLTTLTFGVHHMPVNVMAQPRGCVANLSETDKVRLVGNFLADEGSSHTTDQYYRLCHQVIQPEGGVAHFQDRCCHRGAKSGLDICDIDYGNGWLYALDKILIAVKIVICLLGPIYIPKRFYSEKFQSFKYTVKLKDSQTKTLKVVTSSDASPSVQGKLTLNLAKHSYGFKKCRDKVKQLRPGMVTPVEIKQYDLVINHHRLITANQIPVGFFERLSRVIFHCKIRFIGPFKECCASDVLGREQETPACSWGDVWRPVGKALLVLFIPVPYYIRLIVYYTSESQEMEERRRSADNLGLQLPYEWQLVSYLSPVHPVWIALYAIYLFTAFVLASSPSQGNHGVLKHIRFVAYTSLSSLHACNYSYAFSLMLRFLLWPVDRFGILGVLVGILFWVVAIPLSIIILLLYCLPLFFVTVKIIMGPGQSVLNPEKAEHGYGKLGDGERSRNLHKTKRQGLASRFFEFLNIFRKSQITKSSLAFEERIKSFRQRSKVDNVYNILAMVLCLISLWSTMVVLMECVGFGLDIGFLTLMGILANAKHILKYITLSVTILVYCVGIFSEVRKAYLDLNKDLFKEMKSRVPELGDVTAIPSKYQENRGFIITEDIEEDITPDHIKAKPFRDEKKFLHWHVNDLVLFVDNHDKPYIPKMLFEKVCNIDVSGAPGPIYIRYAYALLELVSLSLFLFIVFMIIKALGDTHQISSNNTILATAVSSFLPYLFKSILKPKAPKLELDTLSFKNKLNEIIALYSQDWPVQDLDFELTSPEGQSVAHDDKGKESVSVSSSPAKTASPDEASSPLLQQTATSDDRVQGDGTNCCPISCCKRNKRDEKVQCIEMSDSQSPVDLVIICPETGTIDA